MVIDIETSISMDMVYDIVKMAFTNKLTKY